MEEKQIKCLEALKASRGIISAACDSVGVCRGTYYRWYRDNPDFRQQAEGILETQVDFVEGELLRRIEQGDTTAIIFYLKTKGKRRGYSEKAVPSASTERVRQDEDTARHGNAGDAKKMSARIRSKKAYIVKLLKEQGKYTAELTYQVDITARLLVRADMLSEEILADSHRSITVEYSREGNERATLNPKEKLYLDVLDKGQKALRALGMNTDGKERKTEADTYSDFMKAMREDSE